MSMKPIFYKQKEKKKKNPNKKKQKIIKIKLDMYFGIDLYGQISQQEPRQMMGK